MQIINSISHFITTNKTFYDFVIELLRTVPALIALIISLIVPFLTKKMDIEKMHKQFMYQQKYEIYTEHFSKLYDFNTSIKSFLVTLNNALHAEAKYEHIEEARENLEISWNNIKNSEAKLWLLAPNHILAIRTQLLDLIKELNKKINSFNTENGYNFSIQDLNELIVISQNIQNPLSQYLDYYRKEIEKVFY